MLARNLRPSSARPKPWIRCCRPGERTSPPCRGRARARLDKRCSTATHLGGALYWVTEYGPKTKWGYGDVWEKERAEGRFKKLENPGRTSRVHRKSPGHRRPAPGRSDGKLARSAGPNGPRVVVFNPAVDARRRPPPWIEERGIRGRFGPPKAETPCAHPGRRRGRFFAAAFRRGLSRLHPGAENRPTPPARRWTRRPRR